MFLQGSKSNILLQKIAVYRFHQHQLRILVIKIQMILESTINCSCAYKPIESGARPSGVNIVKMTPGAIHKI
jgi:hypothetical protein